MKSKRRTFEHNQPYQLIYFPSAAGLQNCIYGWHIPPLL
jgi:hypothetical protein